MSTATLHAETDVRGYQPASEPPLNLRIHADFSTIETLWRSFEADAAMPVYQGFRWLQLWHDHIGRKSLNRLVLVVGERAGQPVFIWPFGVWRAGPFRVARWLGGKLNNYNLGVWTRAELATITDAEMRSALAEIAHHGSLDTFELVNQPKSWEGIDNPFARLAERPSPSSSHAMDLEPDFEHLYTSRRSSRSRRTLRRKREAMAQTAPLKLVHATDEATVLRIVEALVEQRNTRAANAGIPSLFAEPGAMEMTRDILLDGLSASGGPVMEAHALEVDGVIRATYIGGVYGKRYSCFLNSFREDELTASSPGEQLLYDMVRYCCESDMKCLDLGIGEERYKTSWCDPDPLFDSFIAISKAGRLHVGFREFRQSVKRAIKGNPVLWKAVKKARQIRSRAHL